MDGHVSENECLEDNVSKSTRQKLTRKCKQKSREKEAESDQTVDDLTKFLKMVEKDYADFDRLPNIQEGIDSSVNVEKNENSGRVVCNCGFIAKNNFGLRTHWGKTIQSQMNRVDQFNFWMISIFYLENVKNSFR